MVWLLGVFAGALSTTVGMGGGQLLVIGLAALVGPMQALLATGPALLIGNLHRSWMYRREVDWGAVGRFASGAVPGAVLGGLGVALLPTEWLSAGIAGMALLAVVRLAFGAVVLPSWWLVPGGALVGGVAATAGGAGVVAGPLWKGSGVDGDAYVGSMASGAAAVHVARMLGYGAAGLWERDVLLQAAVLAGCIVLGNALGRRLRGRLGLRWRQRLELGAIGGAAVVALAVAL